MKPMSIVEIGAGTAPPWWIALVTSSAPIIGSLIIAGFAASVALKTTRRNLRGNVISTYRQQWLDIFRNDLSELLTLGEIHFAADERSFDREPTSRERVRFRLLGHRLVILLGFEPGDRQKFGRAIIRFVAQPTRRGARQLARASQPIFRERWEQIKNFDDKPALQELNKFGRLLDDLNLLRRSQTVSATAAESGDPSDPTSSR
jgi:hypothetical protein